VEKEPGEENEFEAVYGEAETIVFDVGQERHVVDERPI
jgi:hypothetical protein